jgi:hypothetical protein
MTMKNDDVKQRLVDFFSIYYDRKTAKNVERHPETAIPILKDAIKSGLNSRGLLSAYAMALGDAVAVQGLGTTKTKKGAMS